MTLIWGNAIGPITLGENTDMPRASRNNFPKFIGDDTIYAEQHLSSFHKACGVGNPQHEDVGIRMFVDTLVYNATNWFQGVTTRCITN